MSTPSAGNPGQGYRMLSHRKQHFLLQPESPGHVRKGWDRTRGWTHLVTDTRLPVQDTKPKVWNSPPRAQVLQLPLPCPQAGRPVGRGGKRVERGLFQQSFHPRESSWQWGQMVPKKLRALLADFRLCLGGLFRETNKAYRACGERTGGRGTKAHKENHPPATTGRPGILDFGPGPCPHPASWPHPSLDAWSAEVLCGDLHAVQVLIHDLENIVQDGGP